MAFEAEFSETPMTNERAPTPVLGSEIQDDTMIHPESVASPENTSGPNRADGLLAFEVSPESACLG